MAQTEALYALYREHPLVQTDSRQLREGCLFFALKGPHFNGNAYAAEALRKGAACAVIDEPAYQTDERMLLVDDVLGSLQALAEYHRRQLSIPVLAITGSNGKTTTKELCREVLSRKFRVYATEGNLNNHIGIPLTLLRIRPETELAIIEMGANHQREIASYCRIAHPTHGLITNCGKAHLEGFGGIEGVRKGKGELFDYLREHEGMAFICSDFEYFQPMSRNIPRVFWYGTTGHPDLTGSILDARHFLDVDCSYSGPIHSHLVGAYNIYNILAALAVGCFFKVDGQQARQAVEAYQPTNQRSQFLKMGPYDVILDAYNANPSSMKAAIENFAEMEVSDKVLMLGAMMELGEDSRAEHQELLRIIGRYPWKSVLLVGGDFVGLEHPYAYVPDSQAAAAWLRNQSWPHATLLIKGSRSMRMERILEAISAA